MRGQLAGWHVQKGYLFLSPGSLLGGWWYFATSTSSSDVDILEWAIITNEDASSVPRVGPVLGVGGTRQREIGLSKAL
jgi:hypothetical protein